MGNDLWTSLYESMTWGELVREYDEALAHVERYAAAHPEMNIQAGVHHACERLRMIHDSMRKAASVPAFLDQPAPAEAAKVILSAVGQVKREVPSIPHMGRA